MSSSNNAPKDSGDQQIQPPDSLRNHTAAKRQQLEVGRTNAFIVGAVKVTKKKHARPMERNAKYARS